jgi:1,4-dihydroxy-2-naphthoyl-CoA synthase
VPRHSTGLPHSGGGVIGIPFITKPKAADTFASTCSFLLVYIFSTLAGISIHSSTTMSALQGYSHFKHFNVSSPSEFVAHVEINRPEKLNAFYEAMWVEIGQIFDKLSYDPDVRAVVLTGAGERAFTAGLDVQAASESWINKPPPVDGARVANSSRRHILEFQEWISKIEKCEKRMSIICNHYRSTAAD